MQNGGNFLTFQYDNNFWYILNSVSDMIPDDFEIKSVKCRLRRKIIWRLSYSHYPTLVLISCLLHTLFKYIYIHEVWFPLYFLWKLIVNHSSINSRTARNNHNDVRLKFPKGTIWPFLLANVLMYIDSFLVNFT